MSVYGKRQERLGLHVAPTFGQAISQPLNKVKLPGLEKTEFWNSPAYQGLLNLQQAVETEAELDARRAQLKSLMTRVAHEHHVSITHVHQMVQSAARAGAFDISGGDAPTEAPAGRLVRRRRRPASSSAAQEEAPGGRHGGSRRLTRTESA
jgi:hypothetical protein